MEALGGKGKSDDSEHPPIETATEGDEAPLENVAVMATVVVEAKNESEIGEGSASSEKESNFESDKKMLDTKDPAKENDSEISRDELLNFVESIEREDEENNWLALDDNVDDEGNEFPIEIAPGEPINVDPVQPPESRETDSVEQLHLPEDQSHIHEGVDKATAISKAEENTDKSDLIESSDSTVLDEEPEDEQMDTSDDPLPFLPDSVLTNPIAGPACSGEVPKTDDRAKVDTDSTSPPSPDSLMDMLTMMKQLSPEKLAAIRNKIVDAAKEVATSSADKIGPPIAKGKDAPAASAEKDKPPAALEEKEEEPAVIEVKEEPPAEVGDEPMEVEGEVVGKAPQKEDSDEDCVILLDSDDDSEAPNVQKQAPVEAVPAAVTLQADIPQAEIPQALLCAESLADIASKDGTIPKRKSNEDKENMAKKVFKKSKECANPECPGGSEEFLECPNYASRFYYALKKVNKIQHICSPCHDKALIKFEEMGEALLNNKSIFEVTLPKKQDMVEVIDSDDEDDSSQLPPIPESQKIVFNRAIELLVEDTLMDISKRVDIDKQLKWDIEDLESRCDVQDIQQTEFERQLKILEKQSSTMYNELYSINKQKIEHREPLIIEDSTSLGQVFARPSANRNVLISSKQASQSKPGPQKGQVHTFKRAINPASLASQPAYTTTMVKATATSTARYIISPTHRIVPAITQASTSTENIYYAVRSRAEGKMQTWSPCKKIEMVAASDKSKMYRVQFLDNLPNNITMVKGKDFALSTISSQLTIGTRVIAKFPRLPSKSKETIKRFLPGVIGEKLSKYNKHRYLVFCDYGQVQYASPEEVREVSEASANVWEDVHENLRQFIHDYLQSQTQRQRALLTVRMHQQVETERNGLWRNALVHEIDCSVVKMYFPDEKVQEWLYRGSKRLGPIFKQKNNRGENMNARRIDPLITYITIDDDYDPQQQDQESDGSAGKRNTARKSTAPSPHPRISHPPAAAQQQQAAPGAPQSKVTILNDSSIYLEDPNTITKIRHFTPRASIAAKRYIAHECSPGCLPKQNNNLAHYSPLSKPLLTCWERQIVRHKTNKFIHYKGPCGRLLRNMYEICRYLGMTKCTLNVENFDFDTTMQVLSSYEVVDKAKCPLFIPDMSEGKEGMKIPVINAFDDTRPPELIYSPSRIPMPGVNINTDPDFMSCCDCTDDCFDKTKCACHQMTIQGYKYANRGEHLEDEDISYVWKRLLTQVTTGIYECNSRCKCSSRCLNKVVQQPIQIKMQLYRTKNRGWGLECGHDIPKGTFICIYAGRLYREDDANALCSGKDHGDEYFAELDIIETATPLKEGYESGVKYDDSDSEEDKASDSDSDYDERKAQEDDLEFIVKRKSVGNREILTRSARIEKRKGSGETQDGKSSNDSDSEGEMVNMLPSAGNASGAQPKANRSLRKLFGKNEKVYVMDAKHCGNVGRYFNHSCDPNLFVQSVFVDTHDMRFPWIAFFAIRAIKAGEELTWNYNYEVGSVPSKLLYCKCGSKNCRGRIL